MSDKNNSGLEVVAVVSERGLRHLAATEANRVHAYGQVAEDCISLVRLSDAEAALAAMTKDRDDQNRLARVQCAKLSLALDKPGATERLTAVMDSPDWVSNKQRDAEALNAELVEALRGMVEIAELTMAWLPTPPNADGPLIRARAALLKAQP